MSLDEELEINHIELIKKGLHKFRIQDIKLKSVTKDENTYNYINFELIDLEDNEEYDNLLSIPISTNSQFSERSKLHQLLTRFNIKIDKDFKLTGSLLNKYINREFSALVTYVEQFAEIDIKTIILENIISQKSIQETQE